MAMAMAMAMASNKSLSGVLKTKITHIKRDAPPTHYVLKIESFSDLLEIATKTDEENYESEEFEAGGYKWKLVVYPNGNAKANGKDHISMYIASMDEKVISNGCNVDALLIFFVYDHIRDIYLTIQDGKTERYHVLRTEHGFDQLLSLETFRDSSNGYLANDCCIFGAEVHVIKNMVQGSVFSVVRDPPNATFTWKIDRFSTLQDECCESATFTVGGYKWKLLLYPKGNAKEKDRSLSLFLEVDEDDLSDGHRVYAEYKMSIRDQIHGKHLEETVDGHWFRSPSTGWGYPSFLLFSDLKNQAQRFLVDDMLVVEAEIIRFSAVQGLS